MKTRISAFLDRNSTWLFPLLIFAIVFTTVLTLILRTEKVVDIMLPEQLAGISGTECSTEPTSETETGNILLSEHVPYMSGFGTFFRPTQLLTRADAAVLIFHAFGCALDDTVHYTDLAEDDGSALYISSVAAFLPGYSDNTFRPEEPVGKEDFLAAVCTVKGYYPQDELLNKDAPYTEFAIQSGWVYQDNDRMNVSRAEAAHIINRVSNRAPDKQNILSAEPLVFVDVTPACPYYADILEAVLPHEYVVRQNGCEEWDLASLSYESPESGMHRDNGIAYYVKTDGTVCTSPGLHDISNGTFCVFDSSGRIYADNRPHLSPEGVVFCRNCGLILKGGAWNGYKFDENGFYTTGDENLDDYVSGIIENCTSEKMTQPEKLRACYDYVRSFSYLTKNKPLDWSVQTLSYDVLKDYALEIYQTGEGDCYNFASAFLFLARALGCDADVVVGYCSYSWNLKAIAHAWVTITMDDGQIYLFDPQIENYNIRAGISNEEHGAFMTTYADSSASYYPN